MKVHLIKKQSVFEFMLEHARSEQSFQIWLNTLKYANWERPSDVFQTFAKADLLPQGCNRIVFNVGGNEFRVICKYQITSKSFRLYVKWIGTHAAYTILCRQNKQYTIDLYRS
jgi:mRNA interferase HigB